MNCRSAESLFSALIEDELSQNERRSLETHLLSCRKCSVSLKETRAAMELFQSLPLVEDTSPHFEEDVMARIRSGEGLRPSLIEWIRATLAPPAWLRPVAVAGAGACAVWVVALVYPNLNPGRGTTPVASVEAPAPSAAQPASPLATEPPAMAAAPSGASQQDSRSEIAAGASARERALEPSAPSPRVPQPSDLATVSSETPATGFPGGSEIPSPGAGYIDEYITDQFYLDRGNGGSGNPSVTPVSGRPSDDVYIIF